MDGILLIDKPQGWTSHDVVAKVRALLRQSVSHQSSVNDQKLATDDLRLAAPSPKVKVGHTGTLDPMATGLLILVIGSYTKRAGEFSKLDKVYEAEITLGATSSTGDKEGAIRGQDIGNRIKGKPTRHDIEHILSKFTGKIQQTPHAYSAIKVDGKRAYDLARKGGEVKLEPRQVTVHEITDIEYDYPVLQFTTKVSSGTYIRSLAEDIGEALGTGAYLSALRRTQVGSFGIKAAVRLDKMEDVSKHFLILRVKRHDNV